MCTVERCVCPIHMARFRKIVDDWLVDVAEEVHYREKGYVRPHTHSQAFSALSARRTIAHVLRQTCIVLDAVFPVWPNLQRTDIQGIATAAFSIASKTHAVEIVKLDKLSYLCDHTYTVKRLVEYELEIMRLVGWRLPNLLDPPPLVEPQLDLLLVPPSSRPRSVEMSDDEESASVGFIVVDTRRWEKRGRKLLVVEQ